MYFMFWNSHRLWTLDKISFPYKVYKPAGIHFRKYHFLLARTPPSLILDSTMTYAELIWICFCNFSHFGINKVIFWEPFFATFVWDHAQFKRLRSTKLLDIFNAGCQHTENTISKTRIQIKTRWIWISYKTNLYHGNVN